MEKNILTHEHRITDTHFFFWNTVYSQWFGYPDSTLFEEKGNKFWSAEHYMMYHKAKVFGQEDIMKQCLDKITPRKVKALGRSIPNFSDSVWNKHKIDIVTQANILKFGQNPYLLAQMEEHKDLILVEASPEDPIWGIGLHFDNEDVLDESKWKGQNLLGVCLMEARKQLLS
jgi:ribA/ribD-fused uncharacterized protein